MKKVVKIRIYPNKTQEKVINHTLAACNFVWNKYIEANMNAYKAAVDKQKETGSEEIDKWFISAYTYAKVLTQLKKEDENYKWLVGAPTAATTNTLTLCETSYKNYFKKIADYPRFKSKKTGNQINSYFFPRTSLKLLQKEDGKKNKIKLPVLCEMRVTSKDILPVEEAVTSGRIIKSATGKYYAMFIYDAVPGIDENTPFESGIRLDLGFDDYVTIHYPDGSTVSKRSFLHDERFQKLDDKIPFFQSIIYNKGQVNLSKAIEDYKMNHDGEEPSDAYKDILLKKGLSTGNIDKVRVKLNRVYEKRTNYAKDYICKLVHELTKDRPEYIIINEFKYEETEENDILYNKSQFFKFKERLSQKCLEFGIEFVDENKVVEEVTEE